MEGSGEKQGLTPIDSHSDNLGANPSERDSTDNHSHSASYHCETTSLDAVHRRISEGNRLVDSTGNGPT